MNKEELTIMIGIIITMGVMSYIYGEMQWTGGYVSGKAESLGFFARCLGGAN